MAFHAVIFDLDGTLIDSMGIWEEVPDHLVRRLGSEPVPGLADALRTRDLRAGAEQLIRLYGWDLTADQVLDEVDRLLEETYSTSVPLKPGVGELIPPGCMSREFRCALPPPAPRDRRWAPCGTLAFRTVFPLS